MPRRRAEGEPGKIGVTAYPTPKISAGIRKYAETHRLSKTGAAEELLELGDLTIQVNELGGTIVARGEEGDIHLFGPEDLPQRRENPVLKKMRAAVEELRKDQGQ